MKDSKIAQKEQDLEKEFRKNYIKHFSNLLADNIVSIYKIYGNNHNFSLFTISNISQDLYIFSKVEKSQIENSLKQYLRNHYKMNLILQDKDLKYRIEKVE